MCMADTQSLTDEIEFPIPDGDVFLHAGDFTEYGSCDEIKMFNDWLGTLGPFMYSQIIHIMNGFPFEITDVFFHRSVD